MIKLIIFDFDGTLADTRELIVKTNQEVQRRMGFPVCPAPKIIATIGLPLKEGIMAMYPQLSPEDLDPWVVVYREVFDQMKTQIVPELFHGVAHTLAKMHEAGLVLTVASSRGAKSLNDFLQEMGIAQYFSYVLGAGDVTHAKPNPEPVLKTMKELGFQPSETLVVGDMPVDIQMGLGAGAFTCGVTYGNSSRQELQEAGANYVIDDFNELIFSPLMQYYQAIDLNDYVRVGEGGTAVSYKNKTHNTLAKLYNPGFEADRAVEEFLTACTVFEMGISTPEPYRLVTDGERFGAEYQFIPGKRSFTRIISEEPERLEEISLMFARETRKLHETKADTAHLRSYKETVKKFYLEKDLVPEEYKQRALRFLETVPESDTCVHGDLQIGNIITDGKTNWWIDVGEFAYGVPEWDLGLMYTICHNASKERMEFLFHLTPEMLNAHWNVFLPAYLGTSDPVALGTFTKHILPFYALKVPYVYDMAYHGALPPEALQKLIMLLPF